MWIFGFSHADAGALDHPHHLGIRGLGPRHGRIPQKGPGWLNSPTRGGGQVHQVDRGKAHHQYLLRRGGQVLPRHHLSVWCP